MANHNGVAATPTLCRNSCGFFGLPDQRDLCSKCFNDLIKAEAAAQGGVLPLQAPAAPVVPSMATAIEAPVSVPTPVAAVVKRDRHRCGVCRKKLRLAQQFECQCQDTFCGEHRYADAHECKFDYVKQHQDRLRKDNPEVIAAKIEKI